MNHNSSYGCTQCNIRTTYLQPLFNENNVRIHGGKLVYKYQESYDKKENFIQLSRRTGDARRGVYGLSVLNRFLTLPDQIPRDIMHLVYEGAAKKMIQLILASTRTTNESEINLYLTSFEIPHDKHRKPKGFREFSDWKASDFKMFLYYYWPVMKGHIESNQFVLFAALSCAVRYMNSQKINPQKDVLDIVRKLLDRFLYWFEQVFGEHNCTSNIHGLIHLPNQVENYGHLANNSVFINEDFISTLKSRWELRITLTASIMHTQDN